MAGTEHIVHCHDEQKRLNDMTCELCPCIGEESGPVKSVCPKPNHTMSMHIYLTPAADAPATWCLQSQYTALTRCILTQGRKL
jgi:hypothetical protein